MFLQKRTFKDWDDQHQHCRIPTKNGESWQLATSLIFRLNDLFSFYYYFFFTSALLLCLLWRCICIFHINNLCIHYIRHYRNMCSQCTLTMTCVFFSSPPFSNFPFSWVAAPFQPVSRRSLQLNAFEFQASFLL